MYLRKLNALISSITGLLFMYALFLCVKTENGSDFSVMRMLECICMLYAGLYYLSAPFFLRKRKTGVFIPFLRYSVFITVTGWCLYGLIFLKSYYGLFPQSFQNGLMWYRYGTVAMLCEWLISEKGHFWKQFTWAGMSVITVYGITGTIMNALGHGIDLNGHSYPFMDVSTLGPQIAIGMGVLVFVELWVYAKAWILIDQGLKKKKK